MRFAIFAHYDRHDLVDPYVLLYLRELRTVCQKIVLVSTAKLSPTEQSKLTGLADQVILKANIGYDFASWQSGLEAVDLADCTELVICNDSCYGPFRPLQTIFAQMASVDCDFWGMTSNRQRRWHLQSYFMVFRRAVLQSREFLHFWQEVGPRAQKIDVINDFEIGLSQRLLNAGFRAETVFKWRPLGRLKLALHYLRALAIHLIYFVWVMALPASTKAKRLRADGYYFMRIKHLHEVNLLHYLWDEVLRSGVPFIKIELLRDNPLRAKTRSASEVMHALHPELAAAAKTHLARLASRIESPAEHAKF